MAPSNFLVSTFAVLFFVTKLTNGWGVTRTPCKTKPNIQHDNNLYDRRIFVKSSLLTLTTMASIGPASPQAAVAAGSDDPFAAVDAFAASIGSTPPSSLNPPGKSSNPPPTDSGKGASQPTASSDMSAALKDIRKQKQIDPRTHG